MKEQSEEVLVDYFEELKKESPLVDIEVVLIDLTFLDEGREKLEREERINYLSDSLYARKFFNSCTECQDMAELFLKIKYQQPFVNVYRIHEFIRKLRQYGILKREIMNRFLLIYELTRRKKVPLTPEELKDLGMEQWRVFSARWKPLTAGFWVFIAFLDFVVLLNWFGYLIQPLEPITWMQPILIAIIGIPIAVLASLGYDQVQKTGKWEKLAIFLAVPLVFASNWKVAIVVVFAIIISHFEYTQELIYKNKILQPKRLRRQ